MAITLPARSIGKLRAGRGFAVSGAGDIPSRSPRGSGALPTAPLDQTGAGLEAVGEGLLEFSAKMQAADDRIRRSEESFNRIEADTFFNETTESEIRARRLTGDFSQRAQVESMGEFMDKTISDLEGRFPGSEDHQNRMRSSLMQQKSKFAIRIGKLGADIRKEKTTKLLGKTLNEITKESGLSIGDAFDKLDEVIEKLKDNLNPIEEINARIVGRKALVVSKFESFFAVGALDEAEDVVDSAGDIGIFDVGTQTAFRTRLSAARQAQAGEAFILPPGSKRFSPSGVEIASVPPLPRPPITLSPGQTVVSATGKVIASVPGKPVVLKPGERLVSPQGETVAEGPPEEPRRITLSPGQTVVDEDGKVIATAGEKPVTHTLSPGQIVVDEKGKQIAEGKPKTERLIEIGAPDSPTGSKFVRESEAEGKPGRPRQPLIQNLKESQFFGRLGAKDADTATKLETEALRAQQILGDVNIFRSATESGNFTAGIFSNTRLLMSRFADLLGISGGEISKLIGDSATADTMDQAAARLAVQTAQDGGRITNLFLSMIRDSFPALFRTSKGNLILLDVMEAFAQRKIEIAALASDFIRENPEEQGQNAFRPKSGPSFYDAVRALEEKDPTISKELLARIRKADETAPKSFKELVGLQKDEGIPVPSNMTGEPDGTILRDTSTGLEYEKRGDKLFLVK